MSSILTPYQIPYKFMNDFVIRKYALNIKQTIKKVKISPINYTLKSNVNKKWFVYFWYSRLGDTKRYKHEVSKANINGVDIHINRIKDHSTKVETIELSKDAIIHSLKTDARFILFLIYGNNKAKELYPSLYNIEETDDVEEKIISIEYAFNEVLNNKKNISNTYRNDMASVKNRFFKYLGPSSADSTKLLNKQLVVRFLNDVTKESSNRTYNNIKTNLKTFLEGLKDLEYIDRNFLDGLKNKQTKAKRNLAFTIEQRDLIFKEAKENDKLLYYFLLHVYYELMRPQTVVRIKVKDVDLESSMFHTDTKTGKFNKLILKPLKEQFYDLIDLENSDSEMYIFGNKQPLSFWDSKDENRRQTFTNKFKRVIKDKFFKDSEYTIYSLRHTAIGVAFKNKAEELKDKEVYNYKIEAVKWIMQFTEHKTIDETLIYLRGISTTIHEDWSKYL